MLKYLTNLRGIVLFVESVTYCIRGIIYVKYISYNPAKKNSGWAWQHFRVPTEHLVQSKEIYLILKNYTWVRNEYFYIEKRAFQYETDSWHRCQETLIDQ